MKKQEKRKEHTLSTCIQKKLCGAAFTPHLQLRHSETKQHKEHRQKDSHIELA